MSKASPRFLSSALRFPHTQRLCGIPHTHKFFVCGTLEFSPVKIAHWNSKTWVWDDVGGGCNVVVPNLPRREVGRVGVYWLALGPSARTSGGRMGTATLLPLLVVEGVLSHTLTFGIRKIHSLQSSFLISQTTIVVFKINSSFIFFQNYYLTILKLLE